MIDNFVTDHSIIDFQSNYISFEMIVTLQAICYHLVELLTPPEILQIRFITRECVSKILLLTRDKDGYPISGYDVVP